MQQDIRTLHSYSHLFIAALVSIAILGVFLLLGMGLGLYSISLNSGFLNFNDVSIAAIVFGLSGFVFAFLTGGFLSASVQGAGTVLNGVFVWGIIVAALFFSIGSKATENIGKLAMQAAVGSAAVAGAEAALDELSRMDVLINTDVKLSSGKIFNRISFERGKKKASLEKVPEHITAQVVQNAEKTKNVIAQSCLGLFALLLVGLVSTIAGAALSRTRLGNFLAPNSRASS